jgi:hypothetical protein
MKTIQRFAFGTAIAFVMSIAAQAACPSGSSTWTANNNGFTGTIVMNVVGTTLTGTAFGNPMKGFCDSTTNKVRFWRAVGVSGTGSSATVATVDNIQIYTGYLFPCGTLQCMAGTYESFAGTGATSLKPDYGWYAWK